MMKRHFVVPKGILERDQAATGAYVGCGASKQVKVIGNMVDHRNVGDDVEGVVGRLEIIESVSDHGPCLNARRGGSFHEITEHGFRRVDGREANARHEPWTGCESVSGAKLQHLNRLGIVSYLIKRRSSKSLVDSTHRFVP